MAWSPTRFSRIARALAGAVVLLSASCSSNDTPSGAEKPAASAPSDDSTRPVEWVAFHVEVPFAAADLQALASGLFGPAAQSGKFVTGKEITTGVFLGAAADPTTPEQTRVTLTFNDGTTTPRTMAVVPASFAVGNVFLTTIGAAIDKTAADEKQKQGSSGTFLLQYQVTSTQGGTFSFGVHSVAGVYTLVLDVSSPTTNLTVGSIGTAASNAAPYDLINGTVWFDTSQDEFNYFGTHAYGADQTAGQNFNDFELVPFTWLRLTVTPRLDQKFVNVAFQVVGADGSRTPMASAPASVLAGGLFVTMVDRNMTTMTAQEKAKPGSSSPWQVPFYYDDPAGGGVVKVIYVGQSGTFTAAYNILSPHHTLKDVPFVPYKPVSVTPTDPSANDSCTQLGHKAATQGVFDITFTASTVITNDPTAKGHLNGPILCSVYKATDVTVTGPNAGAKSLQDFTVPSVNLEAATAPHFETQSFPKGSYQILCFQDLLGDAKPDKGDPVTLPIGSFPVACDVNPVTVQFALLNPESE